MCAYVYKAEVITVYIYPSSFLHMYVLAPFSRCLITDNVFLPDYKTKMIKPTDIHLVTLIINRTTQY